jgi:hypothetical protein
MLWHTLPRWIKIPAALGLVALAAIELNKDANESWFSNSIYGGQGETGAAQLVDPRTVEKDAAAGREVSAAKRTITAQWEGLAADAIQKQAVAEAATESETQLLAKQAKGIRLTSTESLRLQELIKLRAEAETAEAQSTAARANALAEKEAAQLNARLIESLQRGNEDLLYTFYDMFVPKGVGLGK